MCLTKANSVACLDTVVIQDLSLGEGQAVDNGDVLEVVYTGWLLQNHTIGQMFDSNHNLGKLMRLKVGAGKVIKVSCATVHHIKMTLIHCHVFFTAVTIMLEHY